jgi:hypothetical protein
MPAPTTVSVRPAADGNPDHQRHSRGPTSTACLGATSTVRARRVVLVALSGSNAVIRPGNEGRRVSQREVDGLRVGAKATAFEEVTGTLTSVAIWVFWFAQAPRRTGRGRYDQRDLAMH